MNKIEDLMNVIIGFCYGYEVNIIDIYYKENKFFVVTNDKKHIKESLEISLNENYGKDIKIIVI